MREYRPVEKPPVVLDMPGQNPAKPRHINVLGRLLADNIRSFVIILMLGTISLVAILFGWAQANRADNNIKVAWVKMYPNGTWDVEFHDENRQAEFFQSTIDYILTQWVQRLYAKVPHSVQTDYGFVYLYLSPEERTRFLSPDGFNAPARAAGIAECTACQQTRIKVRNIDHYDSDRTMFGQNPGTLYRTNVFVQRETFNADGSATGKPEKLIVPLQWRIKSKQEVQADKEQLKQNPIGLEIISYDLLKDVS
jgi:hypothetical protein